MELSDERDIHAGGQTYIGVRAGNNVDAAGYIMLSDPITREELARVSMDAAGAFTVTTRGPLPRAAMEELLELADRSLAIATAPGMMGDDDLVQDAI